jgi:hypothetical protein
LAGHDQVEGAGAAGARNGRRGGGREGEREKKRGAEMIEKKQNTKDFFLD